jgi:hypothetical protein
MLSALVLERGSGVPLSSVATYSVFRFRNSGLTDLPQFLPLLEPRRDKILVATAAMLLFVVNLTLQFSSTALLTDFDIIYVAIQQPETDVSYGESGLHPSYFYVSGVPVSMSDPVYPTYIEYSEPPTDPMPEDGSIFDTGTSIRGFLPFARASDRTKITSYNGVAGFFDTRAVCARPAANLTSIRIRVANDGAHDDTTPTHFILDGHIDVIGNISRFNGAKRGEFTCGITLPRYPLPIEDPEWSVLLCDLRNTQGDLVSSMDNIKMPYNFHIGTGQQFMIINNTAEWNDWVAFNASVESKSIGFKDDGEWLSATMSDSNITLAISLCYIASAAQNRRVTVTRSAYKAPVPEPTASWNVTSGTFDTAAIRHHLNAEVNQIPTSSRSVYELHDAHIDWYSHDSSLSAISPPSFLQSILSPNRRDNSTTMCYRCLISTDGTINHLQTAVFNQVLKTTRSPGRAIQALATSFAAQWYLLSLYMFSTVAPATTTVLEELLAPARSTFFILIAVMTSVHILVVICITISFVWATRFSMLGNVWITVKQIRGRELEEPWEGGGSSGMTDEEVSRRIRSRGLCNMNVGLVED